MKKYQWHSVPHCQLELYNCQVKVIMMQNDWFTTPTNTLPIKYCILWTGNTTKSNKRCLDANWLATNCNALYSFKSSNAGMSQETRSPYAFSWPVVYMAPSHNLITINSSLQIILETTNSFIYDMFNQNAVSLLRGPVQSELTHYSDVIMSAMASHITSLTIVYSTVYSGADQRKHPSSASLAIVRGIHRWPVNSPHKGPVTRTMFPFDEVIMTNGAKCHMSFLDIWVMTSNIYVPWTSVSDIVLPNSNDTTIVHKARFNDIITISHHITTEFMERSCIVCVYYWQMLYTGPFLIAENILILPSKYHVYMRLCAYRYRYIQ